MKNGKDKLAQQLVAREEGEVELEAACQELEVLVHQDMVVEAQRVQAQGQVLAEVGQASGEEFHEGEHEEYDESFQSFPAIFYMMVSRYANLDQPLSNTIPRSQPNADFFLMCTIISS